MSLSTDLRLPGIYFLPPPQRLLPELPPLDVAAFVGFAARGPLHLPVVIEDLALYRDIFGGDLPLAREPGGRMVNAHMPDAVRHFFANGGRRCYIVRVAGEAATRTRFRLPGVVALDAEDGEVEGLASVHAAWVGAWSRSVRLASQLRLTPLPTTAFTVRDPLVLRWLSHSAPDAVQVGDLLQLELDNRSWLFPVTRVEDAEPGAGEEGADSSTRLLYADHAWEQVTRLDRSPPPIVLGVERLTLDGPGSPRAWLDVVATLEEAGGGDEALVLSLRGEDTATVRRGDLFRLSLDDGTRYLFAVEEVGSGESAASPPTASVRATASSLLRLPASSLPLAAPRQVNRLRFDLLLREGDLKHPTLSELSFNGGHPRFWGDAVYVGSSRIQQRSQGIGGETDSEAVALYWALQREERLPEERRDPENSAALAALLAPVERVGEENPLPLYLPLGMPILVEERDFRAADEEDVGKDDLDHFDPTLFFDRNLVLSPGSSRRLLLSAAFDRYYRQNLRLRGLHSLTFIEEVALVALPDGTHLPWEREREVLPEALTPSRMAPFDGSAFLLCQEAPLVHHVTPAQGTTVGGTAVQIKGERFTTSEQTEVLFGTALAAEVAVRDSSTLTCTTPPQGAAGPVSVTVRNWNGDATLLDAYTYTMPAMGNLPYLLPTSEFDEAPLRQLQRVLLDFCQARRDVVAILSVPLHYTRRHCIEWLENLREELGLPRRRMPYGDTHEIADLSYGAVYHPWLLTGDESASSGVRAIPPEGAVCGQIALRERQRQVWVAPANQPLQGVLGLLPAFSTDDWAELFDLHFNLIRSRATEYRVMSAHTLSDERALLQLSVRRLMILLRKVAWERGMDYVFQSNDERYRASIRFALEEMLQGLYERGAFAGGSAVRAFRVSTDAALNPPQSVERGQVVALIQVAPSQPMEFITVLLLRTGDGVLQTIES